MEETQRRIEIPIPPPLPSEDVYEAAIIPQKEPKSRNVDNVVKTQPLADVINSD